MKTNKKVKKNEAFFRPSKSLCSSKAQAMQFGWIFALVIGGAILFLAIFFSGKLLQTGSYQSEAEIAKNLDILLNPFTSISQAEVSLSKPISLTEKTTVNFSCSVLQDSQVMSILVKKGQDPFQYTIKNKYIFAEDFSTKGLWVFAKPFNAPWKVDDLIYIISKNYCFISAPEKVAKELGELNSSLIQIDNCKPDAVTVCFSGICDIYVNYDANYVRTKSGKMLNFADDATMYAAIFSSKMYDCNIERLMKRLAGQASIFIAKADMVSGRGCAEISTVRPELVGLKAAAEKNDLDAVKLYASRIELNNPISCPLY